MPLIKLTRIIPKELVGSTKYDFEEAESIIGETLDYYLTKINKKPKVGEPFFLHNFKTEVVEEVMLGNIFRTKNNWYKYQNVNTGSNRNYIYPNANTN